MNECTQCGAPNPAGAETCLECGRPLAVVTKGRSLAPTSGTAIASLVCGIIGWSLIPVIGAIAAVVLGHISRDEIRRSQGTVSGEGLAIAGLVLGYSSIAVAVSGVVAAIVGTVLGLALPIGLLGCALCGA